MATSPNPVTIQTTFETVLVEWEKALVAGSDGVPFAFYEQGGKPYWTNHIRPAPPIKIATNLWEFPLFVIAVLHLDPVTSGVDGEKEMAARWQLSAIVHAMAANRQMKTASQPRGMPALDPRGIDILDTALGLEGQVFSDLQITFTAPLRYTIT